MNKLLRSVSTLPLIVLLAGTAFAAILATSTGTVTSITYDSGTGLATGFQVTTSQNVEKDYTFETPNERMTDNLAKWKDNSTEVTVDDVDADTVLESGDTVTEN